MIRPELRQAIGIWKELLIALAVLGLGLYWALSLGGILRVLGWGLVLVAVPLAYNGFRRGRFLAQTGADTAGVISLDERQLTYLGPTDGVIVPLSTVIRIFITAEAGDVMWCYVTADGAINKIPSAAMGHEKLFDSLDAFPGADYEKLNHAASVFESDPIEIWRKSAPKDATALH